MAGKGPKARALCASGHAAGSYGITTSSDKESLGHPCDGMVEASVNAAPWCYGFHVHGNPLCFAGYGMDDGHDGKMGITQRPDDKTLREWVDYVDQAIDEDWLTNGGWSPARSLEVKWGDGPHWHKAELTEQAFDLNVDMSMQRAVMNAQRGEYMLIPRLRFKLMKEWCDDHSKFMDMCWGMCSENYKPCHRETSANAMKRLMMIDFIHDENKEHGRALAYANEWWLTYESSLTPPPWKTITEQQAWNQPPADGIAGAADFGGVG